MSRYSFPIVYTCCYNYQPSLVYSILSINPTISIGRSGKLLTMLDCPKVYRVAEPSLAVSKTQCLLNDTGWSETETACAVEACASSTGQ